MYCLQCGTPGRAEARFCATCGAPMPTPVAPAAPPVPLPQAAAAAPFPPPGAPALAGIGDRFLAVLFDLAIGAAVYALIGMLVARRWGGMTESGFSMTGKPALITITASLVAAFLYHWLLEGLFGATLGKGILGITVRRSDGRRCGMGPALVRNLLRIVDAIPLYLTGLVVAIVSKLRQRIGDHAAGTVVVRSGVGRPARVALVMTWFLVFVAGIVGAVVLHREAPALQVVNFAFLDKEDGAPRAAAPYAPEDTVYVRYDVIGFKTGDDGNIHLSLEVVARDPGGLAVYPPWKKELIQEVPAGRPVNGSLNLGLPPFVPRGSYSFEVSARDELKNTVAKDSHAFEVNAPATSPASGLEIRDFALSLAKDGPSADALVLEGGGTIYLRWKIMGVRARGDHVGLTIALRVVGPGGNTVLDEPRYIVVDKDYTYRPPSFFIPMSGYITLPGEFPKGQYTAEFTVTDDAGGTQLQRTATFQMR